MGGNESDRLLGRTVKPIDFLAYGMMIIAAIGWSMILYGLVGLPRAVAMVLALFLGPASVIIGSYILTELFSRHRR